MIASALSLPAQWWDAGNSLSSEISKETQGKLAVSGEVRARFESRSGAFSAQEPDRETGLIRTRLSLTWKPSNWIRVSGMMQDARAPWYGPSAPSTVRDSADLQEGYIELRPDAKTGFGMTAGRMMLNYGDGRIIGSPQWGNTSRTFDHTRVYFRTPKARFEALLVSPVKVRTDEFNRPVLGDRIWGTYNAVSDLWGKTGLDWYILRHDQNRPGGFSGAANAGRLGVNAFGLRLYGPLARAARYTAEGVVQNGTVGSRRHRAAAAALSLTRGFTIIGRNLDFTAEYKYASGGAPDERTDTTFDQLSPANHDKFGHQDLLGWRNIHNARMFASYEVSKRVTLNAMYDNSWLADVRDALYNGAGKAIVRAPSGDAGRHAGQEADLFGTFRMSRRQLGAGIGYFLPGEFLRRTGAARNPLYLYFFHSYTF